MQGIVVVVAMDSPRAFEVLIISCDIVGHSSVAEHQVQRDRVADINEIVARTMVKASMDDSGEPLIIWASGGDGGHVVFRTDTTIDQRQTALDLIGDLRRWAASVGVGLRVTAHAGPVTGIAGADGRIQVVGDGINVAGWLLTRGGPEGVVASDAFRKHIRRPPRLRATFHHDRLLRDKRSRDQRLWLMSLTPDESEWYQPADEDRTRLRQAFEALAATGRGDRHLLDADKRGWEVVHHAKRVMQANKSDDEALTRLADVPRVQLQYTGHDGRKRINPFFEYLREGIRGKVVQRAQLMQRGYNEVICRKGDAGDTMFVILRGRVGVYKHGDGPWESASPDPDISYQEGDIVGELAFALSRPRTADLVALTETVLLSLHYDDIVGRLGKGRHADFAKLAIAGFISRRVLEYISPWVPFLIGPAGDGPLTTGTESPDRALRRLDEHCELIIMPKNERTITFKRVNLAATSARSPGLYILAGGSVRREVDGRNEVLEAERFPLLWVDMPGFMVLPKPRFTAASEQVRVFRIENDGINALDPRQREALRTSLLRSATACFDYDAFISYSNADSELAQQWERRLRERGLHVFRDESEPMKEFPSEILDALMRSRALVALVTENVARQDSGKSWVAREIQMYRRLFTANRRVLPVTFHKATHENVAAGFPPIPAISDLDETAIDKVADNLLKLRDGVHEPPYSTGRISRSVARAAAR